MTYGASGVSFVEHWAAKIECLEDRVYPECCLKRLGKPKRPFDFFSKREFSLILIVRIVVKVNK